MQGQLMNVLKNTKLIEQLHQFQSETKCRQYLEELRWPDGVACPRCHRKTISIVKKRNRYDSNACRYQFSVTAGTVFHDSHLPRWNGSWLYTLSLNLKMESLLVRCKGPSEFLI